MAFLFRMLMAATITILAVLPGKFAHADDADAASGGVYFLLEVALEDARAACLDRLWSEIRDALAPDREIVGFIKRLESPATELHIRITEEAGISHAMSVVRDLASTGPSDTVPSFINVKAENQTLIIRLSPTGQGVTDEITMEQTLTTLDRRLRELGIFAPTVMRQDDDRIVVIAFGEGGHEALLQAHWTQAQLSFHTVIAITAELETVAGTGQTLLPAQNDPELFYLVERRPVVRGEDLADVRLTFDRNDRPAIAFQFAPPAASRFADYTQANIGTAFAIVLDGVVLSAPVIRTQISGGQGIIVGNFTEEEVVDLVAMLQAGFLPARLAVIEERVIGPVIDRLDEQ
ncbi:hypothetical protein SLH49_16590 [Cognatiyoonia sp. IB215446]|uniref:preprotein translocase subunit SecD n=1 Tax=Cognatiyoonia sp. IB215446 TaxID=3097355 RepID=UPI002A125AA4|nr:hypothetical protein [Cognatiyoonia sp. IB215446]MDX8349604.1 hypothetical protein [Cognatiyoonia sp. IB215446]